ncbi:hypothetical protein CRE_09268 [Caenorhabditis remanei]|uniref:Uncharacterized protein n=1 Tax=Caenorhabditis remanei TaxID=31234 RepID=E3LHV7_CAERE|nr:hypothetical protein CRE_09268 [Caenorhabditis remanei]
MLPSSTNDLQPLDSDELEPHVVDFLSGRELHSARKQDREYRQTHDRKYQRYVTKRAELRNATSASKKYREEAYNKQSNCDAQFINNLHTFKTCDAGSGYRAEQQHYAMDFIAENPCGRNELKSTLKKLKNKSINEWMNREDNPQKVLRRAFSCINLSVESLTFRENKEQEEYVKNRRTEVNYSADISNVDVGYLAEDFYSLDTARLLREISLTMKFLIPRVNSNNVPLGDIKISKVLFSTDDHYAYIIPEKFSVQKALEKFSYEFKKWHENESYKCREVCCKSIPFRAHINVVLYLEEFISENTQYRRARHICEVPFNPPWRSHHLYLEIDTGMLRVVEYDENVVKCLSQRWACLETPIMEVRFSGITVSLTDLQVSKHIDSIRRTGRAKIVSIDRVNRAKNRFANFNDHVVKFWSTFDTAVLQTYKEHPKPSLETLFCPEKDCVGLCNTDVYLEAPTPVSDEPLAVEKLNKLRSEFSASLAAYILPNTDSHQNERIPESLCRMKFLSEFTGTGGCAVITNDKAVFWTDNQHFKIAGRELDKTYWTVKNHEDKSTETIVDWLRNELPAGSLVGFDPKLVTFSNYLKMSGQLKSSRIELLPIPGNLIDNFWDTRPYREGDVVKVMSLDSCGKSPTFKMSLLRKELESMKCSATIVCELDDVMWLLNLRGNDIPFSPLTYSYLFVSLDEAHLFIDLEKLDQDAKSHLTRSSIRFHSYKKVHSFLSEWMDRQKKDGKSQLILFTPDTNQWIGSIFGEESSIIELSIVKKVKAKKNPMELAGMRACNIRHSVQMIMFLHWFELQTLKVEVENTENTKTTYTEEEMAMKLEEILKDHKMYIEQSLPTVFSSGEHCSVPLHKPDPYHTVSNLYQVLVQSGVHYTDGTACATRTIWESYPTEEFANSYTLVLKGHIKIANSQFPAHSTIGSRLDILARQVLWDAGMDYNHETGHSVGHCLNIRDTQGDSSDQSKEGRMEAGQVVTLEPAFYEPEKYGVRIGSCYETVLTQSSRSSGNPFLCFQPLTFIPFQTSILVKQILTPEEILWINRYHYRVFSEIGKILLEEEQFEVHEWLRKACEPI